jgi:hypothetical protein
LTGGLAPTLILSEDVSPLPTGDWWHFRTDSDRSEVTLSTGGQLRWTVGGVRTIESGTDYPTTRAAVQRAWEAEVDRVYRLIEPLARSFVFVGRKFPRMSRANVTNLDEIPKCEHPSRAGPTNRFLDVLEAAVEATEKNPNPSGRETIDLAHWVRVACNHFSYVLDESPHFALLADRPFVRVFAEWLRYRDAEEGRRRRVLRSIAAFPTDPAGALGFLNALGRAADQLTALLPRTGLDYYRAAVAAADLAAPDDPPATVPCDVLFMERPSDRDVVVPVVGLSLPDPPGGYPLLLRDGSVAHLAQPPWRLAVTLTSQDPAGGGANP